MIGKVYPTNSLIKGLDCNPATSRKVMFQACNLDLKEGSKVLVQVPLCDFKVEGLGEAGCGGSLKRALTVKANSSQIITAPEIGQAQGEVQMITIKVKYQTAHPATERYLTWEYKGSVYPLGNLMILTGRTLGSQPWQGWDLSNYTENPTSPAYSPALHPIVTSPDMSFGGIMITNPNIYDVDIEILILN